MTKVITTTVLNAQTGQEREIKTFGFSDEQTQRFVESRLTDGESVISTSKKEK